MPPSQWLPLPAERLPVKSIYAILKDRADKGDAPAACRLSAELGRCLMLEDTLESIQQGDPKTEADLAGPYAEQATLKQQLAMNCAGLGSGELNERMGLLRQAALAGNVSAIEEYVSGLWVSQDIYSASYHLDDYRKDAPRLAEAALASGSLWVLMEMQGVYKGQFDDVLISMAMNRPSRPERGIVLDMLLKLASQSAKAPNQPFEARLSDMREQFQLGIPESEYPRLEAQVLDHYRNWFQGHPKSFREMGLTVHNSVEGSRGFNELCSKGYATAEALENPIDWQD
ncbi:MAG: hypothetical protein IPK97_20245 [Ahniella sp.]|nr:hypothetical protein [Ahniella sp.]